MSITTLDSGETTIRTRTRNVARPPMGWLLVMCAVWSIARLAGADRIPLLRGLLVPILAFTPYAALVSIVMVGSTAALRRWRTLSVALAAAGAFAVAVLPRAIGSAAPATKGPLLRVLTANLRLGHADPRALVDLVRRTRADVLNVQEFTPQASTALDRVGPLLPYKATAPIGGALGSRLYARHPLHALPMFHVAVTGLAMPHAEMDTPGRGRVEVMTVHFVRPTNPPGVGQWKFVLVPAGDPRGAIRVLAGDFIATLDHAIPAPPARCQRRRRRGRDRHRADPDLPENGGGCRRSPSTTCWSTRDAPSGRWPSTTCRTATIVPCSRNCGCRDRRAGRPRMSPAHPPGMLDRPRLQCHTGE